MITTKEDDQHTLCMEFRDKIVKWGEYKLGMEHLDKVRGKN